MEELRLKLQSVIFDLHISYEQSSIRNNSGTTQEDHYPSGLLTSRQYYNPAPSPEKSGGNTFYAQRWEGGWYIRQFSWSPEVGATMQSHYRPRAVLPGYRDDVGLLAKLGKTHRCSDSYWVLATYSSCKTGENARGSPQAWILRGLHKFTLRAIVPRHGWKHRNGLRLACARLSVGSGSNEDVPGARRRLTSSRRGWGYSK